jgi:hypothetical protein
MMDREHFRRLERPGVEVVVINPNRPTYDQVGITAGLGDELEGMEPRIRVHFDGEISLYSASELKEL